VTCTLQPNSRRNSNDAGTGNYNMSHGIYLYSVEAKSRKTARLKRPATSHIE